LERESNLERLRSSMMRLAAELDGARLYQAAAYISMAGDSIGQSVLRQAQDERPEAQRETWAEVDLDFTLDEHGQAWMILEGDCHRLGGGDAVCAEMRRFLAGVASGGDGYG
jgi:hypothetical protein